ncbi:hypothetical protein [Priestia megaterium]|uniref:hypothetical protein n=1 Tax=Priestia megaterium TaxID=1404 RepID=UPI002B2514A1|nr:hypothetical protein [Priestia megaterium]MEB2294468.1 hypothetical protein [Priestia megaterium]
MDILKSIKEDGKSISHVGEKTFGGVDIALLIGIIVPGILCYFTMEQKLNKEIYLPEEKETAL